ncbi:MAG: branched-chain amino acid dehydrogenase [Wenzhouxiangellaceae bacterium]
MQLFTNPAYDEHEAVVFCSDRETGLRAIIAIHDTTLGPGFGGCRMKAYPSEGDALTDVLRLSRGMTYKHAACGHTYGGAKAVIIGDPATVKTPALLRAFGQAVDQLAGRYITAEDMGTAMDDIRIMAETTQHVRNMPLDHSGDPSPCTAWGVFRGMQAAWQAMTGTGLSGATVTVEGIGKVGAELCRLLHEAGAKLQVADISSERTAAMQQQYQAQVLSEQNAATAAADIYAPCATGGTLNRDSIAAMQVRMVAGAANNQLADPTDGERLHERGIVYCPDYVINAGGVLSVPPLGESYSADQAMERAGTVADTIVAVLRKAEQEHLATHQAADQLAAARIKAARMGAG